MTTAKAMRPPAIGTIHRSLLNPRKLGTTKIVAPYFFSKSPRMSASVRPFSTEEAISRFSGIFALHSTCEHSARISPHPQLQNSFVVSDWTRDASSPAGKATDASTIATWKVRLMGDN
jgi:hypothetical protein